MRRRALLVGARCSPRCSLCRPRPRTRSGRAGTRACFARFRAPGFPARAYVHPNGRVYEGTYDNPAGDSQRSRVLRVRRERHAAALVGRAGPGPVEGPRRAGGHQRRARPARAARPARRRGRSCSTPCTGRFSPVRDVRRPAAVPAAPDRARTARRRSGDREPQANYGAWGPDGSLYVTDFLQGVVWRVPPGGGAAQVWLSDRAARRRRVRHHRLALAADRRTLLIGQGSSAGLGDGNPATGKIYAVEIKPDGTARRHAPAVGERADRPARRLRRGALRPAVRAAGGHGEPDRRGGSRRHGARALPELARRRRQRLRRSRSTRPRAPASSARASSSPTRASPATATTRRCSTWRSASPACPS